MKWLDALKVFVTKVAKNLFKLVLPGVKKAVSDFLNDEANQMAALRAVQAAVDAGLRGGDAWSVAKAELIAQLGESAKAASDTLLETLLQNAYCAVKYGAAACADGQ